jgi:hypothetical protein
MLCGPAGVPIDPQVEAPPTGAVEATTLPSLPTATQSEADGHDTPLRS